MPIKRDGDRTVLRCINHDEIPHQGAALQDGTTMRSEGNWQTLVGVTPPTPPAAPRGTVDPRGPLFGPRINLNRGQPVRCYYCEVCGYIELYAGDILEPKTWGA